MFKSTAVAVLATLAAFAASPAVADSQSVRAEAQAVAATAPVSVTAGRMIYGANGQRIAPAYRVTSEGTVQVILNGKLVNIPASTLSDVGGKTQTTLTKSELARAR